MNQIFDFPIIENEESSPFKNLLGSYMEFRLGKNGESEGYNVLKEEFPDLTEEGFFSPIIYLMLYRFFE